MDGAARGGNDLLRAGPGDGGLSGLLYGDAFEMHCRARGGDDRLEGGNQFTSAFGDASSMDGDARGGGDVIRTGDAPTLGFNATASGDGSLSASSRGGNDSVHGGAGDDYLLGDGSMFDCACGGNDLLEGGGGNDVLMGNGDFGGANFGNAGVRAGNDWLAGGAGDDTLAGDFRAPGQVAEYGRDTFFFAGVFGDDVVEDFHAGEDRLLFDVPGVHRPSDLRITVEEGRTVIAVADHGAVTLLGFTGPLCSGDLAFY